MFTKTKRQPIPKPPILYAGAETCGFTPEWGAGDQELLALLKTCWGADFDDLTPQLVLADWLAERGDRREAWVRVACDLWGRCRDLKPGRAAWDYEQANTVLAPACKTAAGWRLSCLWGHLLAWHAPAGWDGERMGTTWRDVRVGLVSRSVYWWSLGFLAGRQADAAGRQAYAAGRQAYAAWRQAGAAGRQADAAGRQADAAWSQASAAGSQASAAGRQKLVWRYARSLWVLCERRLPELVQVTD